MARSDDGYERSRYRSGSRDSRRNELKSKDDQSEAYRSKSSRGTGLEERSAKRRRYSSDYDDAPRRRSRDRRARDYDDRPRKERYSDHRRDSDRRRSRSPDSTGRAPPRRRRHTSSDDSDRDYRRPRRDASPDRKRRHHSRDPDGRKPARSPQPPPPSNRRSGPLPSQDASFAITRGSPPPVEKQKPNFAPTGLLAKEANTVQVSNASTSHRNRNIVLKYHEPAEARKPPAKQAWRLYHFVGAANEPVDTIPLFERSCWLFGRENSVVDVLLEDGSCSKQHAVVQFRYSVTRDEFGDKLERVRPYLIDLESKAGTELNGEKVDEGRYVELRDGDVLKFGEEEGEWVVMLPPED